MQAEKIIGKELKIGVPEKLVEFVTPRNLTFLVLGILWSFRKSSRSSPGSLAWVKTTEEDSEAENSNFHLHLAILSK